MNKPADQRWLPMVMYVAIVYPLVGITFAALPTSSHGMLVTWRLAAWLLCAMAFAVHLGFENARLRNAPSQAAWHCALAVALGAFALLSARQRHGASRPVFRAPEDLFPIKSAKAT